MQGNERTVEKMKPYNMFMKLSEISRRLILNLRNMDVKLDLIYNLNKTQQVKDIRTCSIF